jgi:hypothetical protein
MAALLMATCFCAFSFAQLVPLHYTSHSYSAAIVNPSHNPTRHAMQEVSPRNADLPALHAVGLLPVVAVRPHCFPPRMSMRVPAWPMENWPIHRRISPPSVDNPGPA